MWVLNQFLNMNLLQSLLPYFMMMGPFESARNLILQKKLEALCEEVHTLAKGPRTAYIIDGMALLQSLNESCFTTFDDLGCQVLQHIMTLCHGSLGVMAVAIVFDRYDIPHSIKQMERQRCGDVSGATYLIKGSRTVPNIWKFMRISANKAVLADFVSNYIILSSPEHLKDDQQIILAGGFVDGHIVKSVMKNRLSDLQNLYSTQEEADTWIILHAVEFSYDFEQIIKGNVVFISVCSCRAQ